jgi:TolB-like protein/DNA-binding winged helix-turn-helix (wHTH) protein/tetratricopeptide (TPR) repeat protein
VSPRQAHLVYEFGEFRLDALRRVLSRTGNGPGNQPIQVTGKVFDTLLFMVERAGQLLDKRTLMEALWPNVVVEESNLTQTIHTLRRVLGESPGEHCYIVTVPGRGYRFVADVATVPVPAPHQGGGRRPVALRVAAAVAVVVVIGLVLLFRPWSEDTQRAASIEPAIAVLPFVDMSEQQDQGYFGDGLAEEILNLLAQSTGLRVVARTSSFSFKDRKEIDVVGIADTLGVTHVLEGSVRKSGGRIRITAQLVDGVTSAHLWSQTYDRDATDVFGVQDEIAAAVAESLQITLTGSSNSGRGATRSAQAFEHYLQGKYFHNRRGEGDVAIAKEHFEQALKIDPDYARAWAGLAGIYYISRNRASPQELTLWREAVERALALGPNLAESHVRAAQYNWRIGDAKVSEEHCKRAIALNPSDPLVLSVSAGRAFSTGHWSEGISLQRRAVSVDPLAAAGRANLGVFLAAVGEWQEARAQLERARELSPTLPNVDADIARVLILQQRFDEALATVAAAPASPLRDQCLALAHHALGQSADAEHALAQLVKQSEGPDANLRIDILIAEVHAFRGDEDATLKRLAHALEHTGSDARLAQWFREEMHLSPFLRKLHTDARWQSLLARADDR